MDVSFSKHSFSCISVAHTLLLWGDFHRQPINRTEHFFIGCTSVVQAIENIHMMLRAHTVNGGSDSQYLIIVGSEHSCILVLKQAQRSQIWRQAGHFLETCKQNRVKLRIQLLMSNKYALQKKKRRIHAKKLHFPIKHDLNYVTYHRIFQFSVHRGNLPAIRFRELRSLALPGLGLVCAQVCMITWTCVVGLPW